MSKVIAIEAGHGFYTPGKRCLKTIDPNETREWWLSDRVVRYFYDEMKKRFSNYSIVRLDDPSGNTDVSLSARTNLANSRKADVLISIHADAGINGGTGGGITVFRQTGINSSNTIQLQNLVYDSLIKETGLKGDRANPKAQSNLHMLRESVMPAVLCELGFMDSRTDVPIILSNQFARQAAIGLAVAVGRYLNLPGSTTPTPTPTPPSSSKKVSVFYRTAIVGRGVNYYPWVQDTTDYAGDAKNSCAIFAIYPSVGELFFRVSPIGASTYYPEVQNYKVSSGYYDYAGVPNIAFDKLQIRYSDPTKTVKYRVMCRGKWLPWVSNRNVYLGGDDGYAGMGDGVPIQAVQVYIE